MFRQRQQIQELNLGVSPRSDVPRPVLMQSELTCQLLFEGSADVSSPTNGVVTVTFKSCRVSRFGYPNDEALPGHPLYKYGLRSYGVFEVSNSSWDKEIQAQNRIAFPAFKMQQRRHLIITFHDSMFECIAASAVAEISTESFSSAVARVSKVLPDDV